MRMTAERFALAAGAGSAGLLIAALGFQYLGGLDPCPMCIWQRWPHLAAAAAAILFLAVLPLRFVAFLGFAAAATAAGLGLFHAGVEQGWWQGPTGCSGIDTSAEAAAPLLLLPGDPGADAPLPPRCDEIPWSFAGLSMAAWNAVVSLGLAMLWIAAFFGRKAKPDS